jgi:hypothetical protein
MANLGAIGYDLCEPVVFPFGDATLGANAPSSTADQSGVISGVVLEGGATPVPNCLVTVLYRPTMRPVARGWTDTSGAYSFSGFNHASSSYLVIAQDPATGTVYNDLVRALISPV